MSERRVLVTGASKGIGRALTASFAAGGDHVTAVARDGGALEELVASTPGSVTATVCDVTDEAAVRDLFAQLDDIDVLICNAGAGFSAPLGRTSLQTWGQMMEINATSVFLCTREVIGRMRSRNRGCIIVIASTAGRVGVPYTAAYTASKHAAVGLTRAIASELAGTQVRANAICPTFVDTPMTERSVANIASKTGRTQQQSREALEQASPLGRLVKSDEVANTARWLASDGAAAISGQTIVLDGGGVQA